MNDSEIILALELGTSKVQAFIGEITDASKPNILSFGTVSSAGVFKGDILNEKKIANAAAHAISKAENMAKAQAQAAYISISGTHIKGLRNIGSANISGANGQVTQDDIERAKKDAISKSTENKRSYIQRICCGYYVDGEFHDNPIDKQGSILEAEYWLVDGCNERISSLMSVVSACGLELKEITHAALASSYAVTNPKQRKGGVLVIDIGGGTSDYALFKNGRAVQIGTIPVGGNHLTNDIAMGLHLSAETANNIKIKYGKVVLSQEERAMEIWSSGDKTIGDKPFYYDSLNKIICARLEELFEILRDELAYFLEEKSVPFAVITGGVSQTKGIEIIAADVLGVPAEIAKFADWVKADVCRPEFSTALGILYQTLLEAKKNSAKPQKKWFSNIFNI